MLWTQPPRTIAKTTISLFIGTSFDLEAQPPYHIPQVSYDFYDENRDLGDWGTVGTLGALGVTVVVGTAILAVWGIWKLLNSDLGRDVTRTAILRRVSR